MPLSPDLRLGPTTRLGGTTEQITLIGLTRLGMALGESQLGAGQLGTVTRLLGTPAATRRTPGARQLGAVTVSVVRIYRPAGIRRARTLGTLAVTRRQPQSLVHARGQGVPSLSARVKPPGLAHTRVLQSPRVNAHTLTVTALDRVYA